MTTSWLRTPTAREPWASPSPTAGSPRGVRERSEEHTSELQSLAYLVCRLLLEKKKLGRYVVLAAVPHPISIGADRPVHHASIKTTHRTWISSNPVLGRCCFSTRSIRAACSVET